MLIAGLITSVALLLGQLAKKLLANICERREKARWRAMTHRRNMKFFA